MADVLKIMKEMGMEPKPAKNDSLWVFAVYGLALIIMMMAAVLINSPSSDYERLSEPSQTISPEVRR